MKPIVVTGFGEALRPITVPGILASCPFVHDVCNGITEWHRISNTHRALSCECGLRVVIPVTVKTTDDLRAHFACLQIPT